MHRVHRHNDSGIGPGFRLRSIRATGARPGELLPDVQHAADRRCAVRLRHPAAPAAGVRRRRCRTSRRSGFSRESHITARRGQNVVINVARMKALPGAVIRESPVRHGLPDCDCAPSGLRVLPVVIPPRQSVPTTHLSHHHTEHAHRYALQSTPHRHSR